MVILETFKLDPNAQVERQAKHICRTCGGQPKVTKEVMPALEETLLRMRQHKRCAMKRKTAEALLASLVAEGELGGSNGAGYLAALPEVPELEAVEDAPCRKSGGPSNLELLLARNNSSSAGADSSQEATGEAEEAPAAVMTGAAVSEDREFFAKKGFRAVFPEGSWEAAGKGAEAARAFCEIMSASVAVESLSARGLFGELKPKVEIVAQQYAPTVVTKDLVAKLARSVARSVFGEASLSEADELEEEAAEATDVLLRVEDLMLMYGGGHLLLKDTLLELRKNRRYGVVGHNGCGKTTLMKELQAGRVAGMPENIKCVHVSDADLGNMKVLEMTSIAFVKRDMPEGSLLSAEEAIARVGFPPEMQEKPVADLSGGWRMRLLLACVMMKQAKSSCYTFSFARWALMRA
ncbi:unnamed protein product [Polarella glacialis]|uniref:ABC transporter domain-containing protein n=1 Tax=Polarella glacialis TaxID=89957 RepID=A0A813DQW5_POLGL|nr:unnamed protein product [Polarella glacialis]